MLHNNTAKRPFVIPVHVPWRSSQIQPPRYQSSRRGVSPETDYLPKTRTTSTSSSSWLLTSAQAIHCQYWEEPTHADGHGHRQELWHGRSAMKSEGFLGVERRVDSETVSQNVRILYCAVLYIKAKKESGMQKFKSSLTSQELYTTLQWVQYRYKKLYKYSIHSTTVASSYSYM